jgi:hypothetical protein
MAEAVIGDCMQCPVQAGHALGELARQFVPAEEWLFALPEERAITGVFSANAIRTAVEYFRVDDDASSPRYGMPYNFFTYNFDKLRGVQDQLAQGVPLQPADIARMQEVADDRAQRRADFMGQAPDDLRRYAAATRPLLEDVAADLVGEDPNAAWIARLADDLPEREVANPIQAALDKLRDVFHETRGIRRLHSLDQIQFAIARTAVQACAGPWVCVKPRPFHLPPRTLTVCPYGERSKDYAYAQAAAQGKPRA